MLLFFIFIAFWVSCAAFHASLWLAEFEQDARYWETSTYRVSLGQGWLVGLLAGPLTAVMAFFMSGFIRKGLMNPFKIKPWDKGGMI